MILFSIDIDWATDEVIQNTLDLFEQYQVKCTLFATHDTEILKTCSKELFEIGIHPNFNPLLEGKGGHYKNVIDDLLDIYPETKGVRSHSITQSSPILDYFVEKGLLYDSNNIMPYQNGIQPFKLWNKLLKIPYVWEDDVHWSFGKSYTNTGIDLNSHGLKVFAFHPIHIFLNTHSEEFYNRARPYYKDYKQLKQCVNTQTRGTRDLLIDMLKHTTSNQTQTLLEFVKQYQTDERL